MHIRTIPTVFHEQKFFLKFLHQNQQSENLKYRSTGFRSKILGKIFVHEGQLG